MMSTEYLGRLNNARIELFSLLSDMKWLILSIVFISAVLAVPQQIVELFRVIYANNTLAEYLGLGFGVALLSLSSWCFAVFLINISLARRRRQPSEMRTMMGAVAAVIGALPVAGSLIGIGWRCRPRRRSSNPQKTIGSPWEGFSLQGLNDHLVWGAYLHLAVLAVLLVLYFAATPALFAAASKMRSGAGRGRRMRLKLLLVLLIAYAACVIAVVEFDFRFSSSFSFILILIFSILLFASASILSFWTIVYRFPIVPVILGVAVFFAYSDLNDNHLVEPASAVRAGATAPPIARAGQDFRTWLANRPDRDAYKDGAYPVYIVAAQGGGIYAAYQTALFLARMQDVCPRFRHHLFAISSVSGGSVGAATFAAALADSGI